MESIVEDAQARREELIEEHADGAFALGQADRGDDEVDPAAADESPGDDAGGTATETEQPASADGAVADEPTDDEEDDDQAGLTDFM